MHTAHSWPTVVNRASSLRAKINTFRYIRARKLQSLEIVIIFRHGYYEDIIQFYRYKYGTRGG